MDSDSDDDVILLAGIVYLHLNKRPRKRLPTVRINPYLEQRFTKGRFYLDVPDMRKNPRLFKENFHMMPAEFDFLFSLLEEKLQPKINSRPNDGICPEEKLCITLEFLASGTLQRHLASVYRVSKQHIGLIIEDTCTKISEALKFTYMERTTKEGWNKVANDFHKKWNFPNCVGAIDGKHIPIIAPDNAASCFYNYKGYHSIVLMAVSDANYKFIYVDIGAYGSEGDSTVFQISEFGRALFQQELNLPPEQIINGIYTPYMFLGDDAFPLHRNIMKPYKPSKKGQLLEDEQSVFNYRLSRPRRCVENAFGILCSRWIVLARTMFVNPTRAQKIVSACCALHNYLLKQAHDDYCPPGFDDTYDETGNLVLGNWRKVIPAESMMNSRLANQSGGRPARTAIEIRNHIKTYFNSPAGSLAWQRRAVFLPPL